MTDPTTVILEKLSIEGLLGKWIEDLPEVKSTLQEVNVKTGENQYERRIALVRYLSVISTDKDKAIKALMTDVEKMFVDSMQLKYSVTGFLAKPTITAGVSFSKNGDIPRVEIGPDNIPRFTEEGAKTYIAFCFPAILTEPGMPTEGSKSPGLPNIGLQYECLEGSCGVEI